MSNEPGQGNQQDSQQQPLGAKPKKRLLPPSRIAIIILVIAAAVLIVPELRARSAFNKSYDAIEQAIADQEAKGLNLYKIDLDQYLQGSFVREPDQADSELFTWNGVLQSYRMRLHYGRGNYVSKIEPQ